METIEFKITKDQESKIADCIDAITMQNSTLSALCASIEVITENQHTPGTSIRLAPVEGIPYLTNLAHDAILQSEQSINEIYEILFKKE